MKETKCCKDVHIPQSFGRFAKCRNSGKIKRDGKWYCSVHDPEKVKARREAASAKAHAKYELDAAKWRLQSASPDLLEACQSMVAAFDAIDKATACSYPGQSTPPAWWSSWSEECRKSRAAIAKATGAA